MSLGLEFYCYYHDPMSLALGAVTLLHESCHETISKGDCVEETTSSHPWTTEKLHRTLRGSDPEVVTALPHRGYLPHSLTP